MAAAASGLGGKGHFKEARAFGSSSKMLAAAGRRKSSVDGIDSQESRSVVKILSKGWLQLEAEQLMKNFDRNLSKDLDREEFRRLLQELDENKRLPLPANFE